MTAGTALPDTRSRLLDTALRLLSEHGMEGTSLQMIADALGVTKATVYYHFRTKDDLVQAIASPPIQGLDQLLDDALTRRSRSAQVDHALQGLVDLIVRHRALFGLINSDPGVRRVVQMASRAGRVEDIKTKLIRVLAGEGPSLADALATHVVFSGLSVVGGDPAYAGIDDDVLRQHLLDVGKRLLGRSRR